MKNKFSYLTLCFFHQQGLVDMLLAGATRPNAWKGSDF